MRNPMPKQKLLIEKKMKYIKSLFTTTLGALAFAASFVSCSNDNNGSYELHNTYFYPISDGKQVYADQTTDSIKVVSTDNFSFTTPDDATWFTATDKNNVKAPFSVTVPAGYIVTTPIYLSIQPNTTGALRRSYFTATSVFGKVGAVSQIISQAPYLNISTPSCQVATDNTGTTRYTFTLDGISSDGLYHAKDAQGKDITSTPFITFTVYSDDATLTSSESWLSVKQETATGTTTATPSFKYGELQKVNLSIAKNETGSSRSAVLTLTSNGVSTTVTVTQNK